MVYDGYTVEKCNSREDWLVKRLNGIGGSAASAVIGLNPYKSNVELWKELTHRTVSEDISDKPYVIYGNKAEGLLRELFILDYPEYEVYHNDLEILRNKQYPFLSASLDGILTEKATGRKGILEIKTTNILQSMQKEKWNDKVPDNYYIQVLHYLAVTGFDFAILKAQLKTQYQNGEVRLITKHYLIERLDVEEDINYLTEKEVFFWNNNILLDKKPNLLLPAI